MQFIIKLATAYNGYRFYLPAFLDFRGRIYRSGILHFHERDLARSLLVFADTRKSKDYKLQDIPFLASAAFHYKSFVTVDEGLDWLHNNLYQFHNNPIELARDAKRPFQFLASIRGFVSNNTDLICNTPITQDASASAYQIMSYFLMDETLAERTNLIQSAKKDLSKMFILSCSKSSRISWKQNFLLKKIYQVLFAISSLVR